MHLRLKHFLLPALLLALILAAVPAFAEETETTVPMPVKYCGDGAFWSMDGSTLCITGTGAMIEYVDGFQPWYEMRRSITGVVVGDGITSVGSNAFRDMDGITWASFGNTLERIGDGAFYSCDNLLYVSFPDSFRELGRDSFRSCWKLNSMYFVYMPAFGPDCVTDTRCKIYYPAEMPWAVADIAALENLYEGNIEILGKDGSDRYSYVPPETEPTEAAAPDDGISEAEQETITAPERTLPSGLLGTPEGTVYMVLLGIVGVTAFTAAILLARRAARRRGKKQQW